MTIENRPNKYVTYDEFNTNILKVDEKFEDLTEIMLREFDKVYVKFDELNEKIDKVEVRLMSRIHNIESILSHHTSEIRDIKLTLNVLVKNMDILTKNMDLLTQRVDLLAQNMNLVTNHLGITSPSK